jgi:GxxExxY protein
MSLKDENLTSLIIGGAFKVHRVLGSGFLEKVYENALAAELRSKGLDVQQQSPVTVVYESVVVGEYFADLLIENRVICELKAMDTLIRIHEVQLVNYLIATGMDTGLLINFGKRVCVRRKFRECGYPVNPVHPVNPV